MCSNTVEPERPQMTIWRMHLACWRTKATDAHSDYVVFIALPQQQWLHEHVPVLRYAYKSCLVMYCWRWQLPVTVIHVFHIDCNQIWLEGCDRPLVLRSAASTDGFSCFLCVYKQMLRQFPRFKVATTCFSSSLPDLNLLVTSFIFCIHVK